MTRYIVGIASALALVVGAAVYAAPGDGSTGDGIIQGTKVDGKAIAPASVSTTGNVSVGGNLAVTGTTALTGAVAVSSVTASGAIQAEQLTSTDDASITGTLTCGDAQIGATLVSGAVAGDLKVSADNVANHGFVLDGHTTNDTLVLRNAADGAAGDFTCGALTLNDVLAQKTVTIADGDTSPAIDGGNLFVTSANTGATAISDLDLPTVGQVIAICGGSNTNPSTIADAGNFALNDAMTLGLDQCIWLYVQADNDYVELGRSNQSTDLVSDTTPQLGGALDTNTFGISDTTGPVDIADDLAVTGDVFGGDDWLPAVSSAAADVAPVITTVTTQEPYAPASPPAARPTNTTGGNLTLAPANGDRRLGSAGANGLCVADPCVYAIGQTITIPTQTDGVTTNCVLTSAAATSAATREFLCDGETPAACAAAIDTAASTVSPCSLLSVVNANETVSVSRVAGSVSYIGPIVPSAAGITAQNGTDGVVLLPSAAVATATTAQTCFSQDQDTCIYTRTSGGIGFGLNGNERISFTSGGDINIYANAYVGQTSAVSFYPRAKVTSPVAAGGYLLVQSDGDSAGAWQSHPQTITCDADCDSPVTITGSVVIVNCTNAGGCALGLAETNWSATISGVVTLVAGTTQTGALTLADAAGVTELAGGTNWTPTAGDTLQLVYNPSALTWAEVARADVTP